ncbi:hypothetical protein FIBSPDRAFT_506782 [Athelia psychrophila]|uniref:Uncharacterized protein n=1 Tax=Athelia psychrophila TaxID=1759441 RepID=A0A167UPW9_9AGAM|nr:hypothetical protein FIBSPDRAFT_424725 [Fibularhizoctonia sp. CBS 109695]KZP21395.1 hypothetical protein FIBSPDRAFT_506782 [Fibularhizoctonia sp. CBS 109695]
MTLILGSNALRRFRLTEPLGLPQVRVVETQPGSMRIAAGNGLIGSVLLIHLVVGSLPGFFGTLGDVLGSASSLCTNCLPSEVSIVMHACQRPSIMEPWPVKRTYRQRQTTSTVMPPCKTGSLRTRQPSLQRYHIILDHHFRYQCPQLPAPSLRPVPL